jgi:hypothetical protein
LYSWLFGAICWGAVGLFYCVILLNSWLLGAVAGCWGAAVGSLGCWVVGAIASWIAVKLNWWIAAWSCLVGWVLVYWGSWHSVKRSGVLRICLGDKYSKGRINKFKLTWKLACGKPGNWYYLYFCTSINWLE